MASLAAAVHVQSTFFGSAQPGFTEMGMQNIHVPRQGGKINVFNSIGTTILLYYMRTCVYWQYLQVKLRRFFPGFRRGKNIIVSSIFKMRLFPCRRRRRVYVGYIRARKKKKKNVKNNNSAINFYYALKVLLRNWFYLV